MFKGHVSQVGIVERVQFCDKGSAIVTYGSPEEAQAALSQLNGTTIEGNSRYIDVIPQGDDEDTNVFVRGFDFGTTERQIQMHCATAGKVTAVEMWGNGAAVVTYGSAGGAQKAIAILNGSTIPGNSRFIDVKEDAKSRPGPPPATNMSAVTKKRPAPASGAADAPGCRVFIRGFDFGTTDEMFDGHVSQVGTVEQVQWCTKGSAIVTYSSSEEAQAAVAQLNGATIEGNSRYIDVIPQEDEGQPRFKAARSATQMATSHRPVAVKTERWGKDPAGSGRVFVRGFDFGTPVKQFESHMGQVGEILKVFWVSEGAAVVVYKTRAEAEAAVASMNRTVIPGNSRYIDVIPKESE